MADPHAITVFESVRLWLETFVHYLVVASMLCLLYALATANTCNLYYCATSLMLAPIIGLAYILHLILATQEFAFWGIIWLFINMVIVSEMISLELLSILEACRQILAGEGLEIEELLREKQAQLKELEDILRKWGDILSRKEEICREQGDTLREWEEALTKQEENLKMEEERIRKAERPDLEDLESQQTAEEMSC